MDKQKARAAFEKWLESLDTFPAYQYDTMLKAQNAYLAGAEWAWGEALKRSNETAERDGADYSRLWEENQKLRECLGKIKCLEKEDDCDRYFKKCLKEIEVE